MEHFNDYNPNAELTPKAPSRLKRIGRAILRTVFPFKVTEYQPPQTMEFENLVVIDERPIDTQTPPQNAEPGPAVFIEPQPEPHIEWPVSEPEELPQFELQPAIIPTVETTVVAIARDGNSLHFIDDTNQSKVDPVTTESSTTTLFNRFAKMYMAAGEGGFTCEEVADQSGYQKATVLNYARKLNEVMPPEVFRMGRDSRGEMQLQFGKIAIASLLTDTDHSLSGDIYLRAMQEREQRAAEIDRGKQDLTVHDHAIIHKGDAVFYMALHSDEAILAARVIEAISTMHGYKIPSHEVAMQAWQNMTVAERLGYVKSSDRALSDSRDEGLRLEDGTIRVLRRLTNTLMLTLEPRSDRFTLMTEGLSVAYKEEPVSSEFIQEHPTLRPIFPPGSKDANALTEEEKAALATTAKINVHLTRSKTQLSNKDALDMLDFIMSPGGRQAINEISGTPDGYARSATALRAMHRHIKKWLGPAYAGAYRQRLINGNRVMLSSGRVKQVGGRLRSDSTRWTLGRSMNEAVDHTIKDINVEPAQPDVE